MRMKNNANENRFEPLKLTLSWSNMKRVPGFELRKSRGREDGKIYLNKEH